MAVALGAHAAIALSAARRSEQFHSALYTRDVIGQAKGIIMERYRIGSGAAFELLTRLSQDTNTPLAQIAHELVQADFPPADS
ncbi:MAG: ANTAR domain-containing protein, partial [Mycobacterium sp.]|nr:ANTAR domain-containing protein [Mycobacterium sp.]